MLVVGLTGGIGSGKSTVSDQFARLGVPVIDADQIARELAVPGAAAYGQLLAAFGADFAGPDGSLDRTRLRRLVMADPQQRRRLEAILHPLVRREAKRRIAVLDAPYCIYSVPLLVESGPNPLIDRVLVVDCPESLQRSRVAGRSGWSAEEIDAVLAAQASREQRLQAADDVLVNDRDLAALGQEVGKLHQQYLRLSASHDSDETKRRS